MRNKNQSIEQNIKPILRILRKKLRDAKKGEISPKELEAIEIDAFEKVQKKVEEGTKTGTFLDKLRQLVRKRWFKALREGADPEETVKDLEKATKELIENHNPSKLYLMTLIWLFQDFFEPVTKINADRWKLVVNNKEFKNGIKLLRKKVPSLSSEEDITIRESPDNKVIYDESKWLDSQPKEFRDEFDKRILAILNKFDLPYSFYNKVEKYILYPSFDKKVPVPIMNICDWSPLDSNRQLTTVEKQFLKKVLQKRLGAKRGRLPKDKKEASEIKIAKYKINKILGCVSKNPIRRKRELERNLKILEEMGKRKRETKSIYTDYLYYVEKENKKGKISDEEFEKWKKLHPSSVQKYIDKYNSKDVAEKILGDRKKDATIRKAFQRINREIEKSEN